MPPKSLICTPEKYLIASAIEWVPRLLSFSPESICTGTTSWEVRVATTITSSMLRVVSEAQFFSATAVESRSWAEAAKKQLPASIAASARAIVLYLISTAIFHFPKLWTAA